MITKPAPFIRDICGPGNRIELPYNGKTGIIQLPTYFADQWMSELTSAAFRPAVRSIAKERARAHSREVRVIAVSATIYTAKCPDLWKALTPPQKRIMTPLGAGAQPTCPSGHHAAIGYNNTLTALERKGYIKHNGKKWERTELWLNYLDANKDTP